MCARMASQSAGDPLIQVSRHAIDVHEVDIVDADGAEDCCQVGRQEIGLACALADDVAARRHQNECRPVREQSDLALRRAAERAPEANDLVDPGLEQRRHRKIVHGRAEHQEIAGLELADKPLGGLRERRRRGRFLQSDAPSSLLRRRHRRWAAGLEPGRA